MRCCARVLASPIAILVAMQARVAEAIAIAIWASGAVRRAAQRLWCWRRRGGLRSGRNRCRDRRWGGLLRSSHEQHLVGVARIQARDHVCVCVNLQSLENLGMIKTGVSLKNQCRTSGDMRASHGSATVCCRGSVAGVPGRQNAAAWCPDVCARPIIGKRRSSILGCGRADSDG